MRSIELDLDDAADAAFRSLWAALAGADLPSLASHTSASNRPHVTLAAADELPVPSLVVPPPTALRFGPLAVFRAGPAKDGSPRFVLIRAVVVTRALADFHRRLHEDLPDAVPETRPDGWTPHVTLARRMTAAQVAAALDVLAQLDDVETARVAGVRHWNGSTKTLTTLTAAAPVD